MGLTPLLSDYFNYQQEYERIYGSKTVVLYQVGSFYEVYQIESIGKTKEIADILNIQVTKKNKSKPHGDSNPYMLGFPLYAVTKFIKRLINNHYTVAKFDQRDIDGSEKKDRVLDKIYSVSTYIENETSFTNNLIAIIKDDDTQYTLSSVDLTTGHCEVYETYSTIEMKNNAENEAYRFVYTLNPSEILLYDHSEGKDIISKLGLNSDLVHYRDLKKEYSNVYYQNAFLEKVYGKCKNISQIEGLGLERYPDSVKCFIFLLQFAYEHDPTIIKKLQKPIIYIPENKLILNRDTFSQLNIFGQNKKYGSIFNLVNFCLTNMGKRLLKDRLLNPILDKNEIERRYDAVDFFIQNDSLDVKEILEQICDLDKKHRKAILGKIRPDELYGMITSYDLINQLLKKNLPISLKDSVKSNYRKFVDKLYKIFVLEKIEGVYEIKSSIFHRGIFPEIDLLDTEIKDLLYKMETEKGKYSDLIDNTKECVKIMCNETEGHYMQTTPLRFKSKLSGIEEISCTIHKNIAKFTTPLFKEFSLKYRKGEKKIVEMVIENYKKKLLSIYKVFLPTLSKISNYIAQIDLYYSSAKCSKKYRYVRPNITDGDHSSVQMVNCRHPLIERLIDCEYTPNNISLDSERGMLLYGINSSGKSSLLKSIGCNVVMAQAGLFVPCDEMYLTPFNSIYSKIISDDNLFKGQSTFVKEMSQLRDILQGANARSLVLADELCSGTESLSATAILASTLKKMESVNSCYVFSTHLHDLPKLEIVKNLQKLGIYHFNVFVQDEKVMYDRTLSIGSGSTMYGLEIAKALEMDSQFIADAFATRESMSNRSINLLETKKSRYNAKKFVHQCEKCGKQGEGLHTHHIKPQKLADKDGMIGNTHKNVLQNLMVLCEDCHESEHKK